VGSITVLVLLGAMRLDACAELDVRLVGRRSESVYMRPMLIWREVPQSTRYRIELESSVPEGPVLFSVDTQVASTSFQPPKNLTDCRAAVKVRVTSGCAPDDGSLLRGRPAILHIDTSSLCPAPARIARSADGREIQWPAVPAAIQYEVTLLRSDDDATIVSRGQTNQPRFALPPTPGTLVAVVRPYCPTGFGPYGSALVTSSE
jgi:hypothetical protein